MNNLKAKIKSSEYALDIIAKQSRTDLVLGIGTGTTTNEFIKLLPKIANKVRLFIPSSIATEKLLHSLHLPTGTLSDVINVDYYIDGADQINPHKELIKGGGGAMTREKIVALASKCFICIADEEKMVKTFTYKVPVEVLSFAKSFFARKAIELLGCSLYQRENFLTDNGNPIIDLENLKIGLPEDMEDFLSTMPGVVGNGIFARRKADVVILSDGDSVRTL